MLQKILPGPETPSVSRRTFSSGWSLGILVRVDALMIRCEIYVKCLRVASCFVLCALLWRTSIGASTTVFDSQMVSLDRRWPQQLTSGCPAINYESLWKRNPNSYFLANQNPIKQENERNTLQKLSAFRMNSLWNITRMKRFFGGNRGKAELV